MIPEAGRVPSGWFQEAEGREEAGREEMEENRGGGGEGLRRPGGDCEQSLISLATAP